MTFQMKAGAAMAAVRCQAARKIPVTYLLRLSAALAMIVSLAACERAVTNEPEPDPMETTFSFVGTWRYETPRSEMLVDGEDYEIVGTEIHTVTFTKSRWIEHRITIPNDLAPPDMDVNDHTDSGTWGSVTDSTITKTFLDWNDEEDRPEDEPTHVIRKYDISGDVVFMQPWHENEPTNRYVIVERVENPVADLVGRWVQISENENGPWMVAMTLGADGSFQRVYTEERTALPPLDVTGTYELDPDEKYILVTITSTLGNGEAITGASWAPGEKLRFAYAPSNNPNLIVLSLPWWEQQYDSDLGMRVEHPENPHGAYWDRLTKVE